MLSIFNLKLLRGSKLVLSGFSAAGDSHAAMQGLGVWLLGANGSGKTSLLRAIAGLLPVLEGTITAPASKLFIGAASGDHPALTAFENLQFWCGLNNAANAPVAAALAQAGLAAVAQKPLAQLSAGQRQRLALARLLCSDAKLWLLDEPFSALDTDGQQWLCGVLQQHIAKGGAVVCATHRMFDVPGMQQWSLPTC